MKILLILGTVILLSNPAKSQEQFKYPCDSISMSLRSGAKAVIRSCQRRITVVNEKRAYLETRMAITLLNDKALNLLMIGLPYDDLRKVSGINARVYNESGKLIWTLNKYNIQDHRNFNGPQKLDDSRKKVFEIPSFNYPFTIEYSYTIRALDLFMSPTVFLQPDEGIAVEESGLQYVIPEDIGFHFKRVNFSTPVDSFRYKSKLFISWKIENIPAVKPGRYAVSVHERLPAVFATPLSFNLGGYEGSFQSWNEYGRWMSKLISGRDRLEDKYIKKINALTDTCTTKEGIVRVLYGYLQKSTHYFYVGFGIGASQPIPANDVAGNGYGDCKALCNYMKAMLSYKGIESFYTLVPSGEGRDLYPDIPCNQFDHVILCVPMGNDTIWLECTDPDSPFNYLGSFTSDRHVLAITPEGGKLLKTPLYNKAMNIVSTASVITVDTLGNASVRIKISGKGLMSREILNIAKVSASQRKQWLADKTGFMAFNILNESFSSGNSKDIPVANAEFFIEFRNLALISGKRMVLSPSFFSRMPYLKYKPSEVEIDQSFREIDSVIIRIPSEYEFYYLPGNCADSNAFGSIRTSVIRCGNMVYFSRQVSFNKGIHPVSEFGHFYDFINKIARSDNEKIVLNFRHTSPPGSPGKLP